MARFAIAAVFGFDDGAATVLAPRPVVPVAPMASTVATEEFCAFTADLVRVGEERRERVGSRLRHPSSVSWFRQVDVDGGGPGHGGLGSDHRAA